MVHSPGFLGGAGGALGGTGGALGGTGGALGGVTPASGGSGDLGSSAPQLLHTVASGGFTV